MREMEKNVRMPGTMPAEKFTWDTEKARNRRRAAPYAVSSGVIQQFIL